MPKPPLLKLSAASLPDLPAEVARPEYDRSEVTAGILHIGVGGFHRAHLAFYVDRLLNAGQARDWGICGVGLLPGDRRMRDALAGQDHLYTLVEKDPDGTLRPRVIGSIVDFLLAEDDAEAILARMAAAETKIVSLTITEGGYNLDPTTAEFLTGTPSVVAEAAGGPPTSAFGFVVAALRRRREAGIAPFTVMSCDNIESNGDVAHKAFGAYARMVDPELGDWLDAEVPFPNCMVDRITPVTADADREALREQFGVEDAWPVVCEPFIQWVLQDSFRLGRPEFADVGVEIVDDVHPYELMKLRILNASHQALAYLGAIAGYTYVHEVLADETFAAYLMKYITDEAIPTLKPVPGTDFGGYAETVLKRFASPQIRDTLERLTTGPSNYLPKFVLPVIRDQVAAGGPVALTTFILACLARFTDGTDESGEPLTLKDPNADALRAANERSKEQPAEFLRVPELFGDIGADDRVATAFTEELTALRERGTHPAVESLLSP